MLLCSKLYRRMKESGVSELSLDYVNAGIFVLLLEWTRYHQNDQEEEEEEDEFNKRSDVISEWDLLFFGVLDLGSVHKLITAANFLQIKRLFETGLKTVANMLKDDLAQTNTLLNTINDLRNNQYDLK